MKRRHSRRSRRRHHHRNPIGVSWWFIGGGIASIILFGTGRITGALGVIGGLYEFDRGQRWLGGIMAATGASFLFFPEWPMTLISSAPTLPPKA
jgi:hypothetical protein